MRSSELQLASADEEAFAEASAALGFTSAVIAPAPTCAGQSRIGVLCLGSNRPGFFDDDGSLRLHMAVWVDGKFLRDRKKLSDAIAPDARIDVFQAISGG